MDETKLWHIAVSSEEDKTVSRHSSADFWPKITFIGKSCINATFGCVIIMGKNYVFG
jgi:hypothetical protein